MWTTGLRSWTKRRFLDCVPPVRDKPFSACGFTGALSTLMPCAAFTATSVVGCWDGASSALRCRSLAIGGSAVPGRRISTSRSALGRAASSAPGPMNVDSCPLIRSGGPVGTSESFPSPTAPRRSAWQRRTPWSTEEHVFNYLLITRHPSEVELLCGIARPKHGYGSRVRHMNDGGPGRFREGCTTRLVLRHHLGHGHRVRRASAALGPAHRASTAAAIVVDWWLDQRRWHRQRWLRPECVEIFALSRPQPLPEEYLNET